MKVFSDHQLSDSFAEAFKSFVDGLCLYFSNQILFRYSAWSHILQKRMTVHFNIHSAVLFLYILHQMKVDCRFIKFSLHINTACKCSTTVLSIHFTDLYYIDFFLTFSLICRHTRRRCFNVILAFLSVFLGLLPNQNVSLLYLHSCIWHTAFIQSNLHHIQGSYLISSCFPWDVNTWPCCFSAFSIYV